MERRRRVLASESIGHDVSEAHDWRRDRDEYIAGRLNDDDDERQRNIDLGMDIERPTFDEMIQHFARERIEVENRDELAEIAEKALLHQWWRDLYHAQQGDDE